jgi:hypothetical protein
MKRVKLNAFRHFVSFLLLSAITANLSAQVQTIKGNTFINSNSNGYIEYLPQGYSTTGPGFPLLIFIMGINSHGDGSVNSIETRFFGTGGGFIQDQVRAGEFPDSFRVNGQDFYPIIISPQFRTDFNQRLPTPAEMDSVINFAIANYNVDTSRIYLTGNSSGGGPVWDYVGASSRYADRIAAILPFSAVSHPTPEKAANIRNSNVAVWAFHNDFDPGVPSWFTKEYIRMINSPTPASPEAKLTLYPDNSHASWWNAYMRVYEENNMNIYEWMFQFQRPVTKANAGLDAYFDLPTSSRQLSGSGTGPNGTASSYLWTQTAGPAGATFSNATSPTTTVSNLQAGNYMFRLTITDNAGGTAFDDVAVTVNPAPVRVQAEDYTAMSGVQVVPTDDAGGGNKVSDIGTNDWVEYTVNIPTAGTYPFRFRSSTWSDGVILQVRDASGNILDTVKTYNTGGYTRFITFYEDITLPAGQQTLRLQNVGTALPLDINWFEIVGAINVVPLPVDFVLFNANCVNGAVNLLWKTGREINSKYFAVEKSTDGRSWTSVTMLPAAGQSTVEQTYSFRDASTTPGNLYRIVEYAEDGRKSVSASLRSNCGDRKSFNVFPNPVADKAVVNISLDQRTRISLSVVDSKGAIVRRQDVTVPEGSSQVTVDMNNLPKGNYTLLAQWGSEMRSTKLIKE